MLTYHVLTRGISIARRVLEDLKQKGLGAHNKAIPGMNIGLFTCQGASLDLSLMLHMYSKVFFTISSKEGTHNKRKQ